MFSNYFCINLFVDRKLEAWILLSILANLDNILLKAFNKESKNIISIETTRSCGSIDNDTHIRNNR